MHFMACEEDFSEFNNEAEEITWLRKKDFETSTVMDNESRKSSSTYYSLSGPKISFPYIERKKTWEQLFAECDNYRKSKALPDEDIVVLLTDLGNELNWFGGVAPSMKNYFIQTSNWEHFFGNSIDIRFPIAYEIIIWVMRYYMFPDREETLKGVHKKSIGCIMDFCKDKSQIILKMRTADVCESCMNKFIVRDIPTLYSRQFFDILDGIRNSMTFRGRATLLQQPSRMEIRGHTKKIFFTDLGGLELALNPKEKAIYFLFLNFEEGIRISHLSDYRNDLEQLYRQFSNLSERELIDRAIDVLINPLENDINVVLSRINRKIKNAVGDSLYDFYCIKGERGEKKSIKLNRELIMYT
ncbi:hypothetical protein GCM10022388_28240 [Flavobacterium chungnamense]|uniref:Uncharacterized protein n=2 Tax=Flavobacterium chungnamense TaxID=706182 RepID=A0ABP7V4Z5_9FLAO